MKNKQTFPNSSSTIITQYSIETRLTSHTLQALSQKWVLDTKGQITRIEATLSNNNKEHVFES